MLDKLPEKWCIRWGNKTNFEIIQKYLNTINPRNLNYTHESIHSGAVVTFENNYIGNVKIIPNEYTEITFEEFKKFVLNKETELNYEIC